jgi:hypothetical protein
LSQQRASKTISINRADLAPIFFFSELKAKNSTQKILVLTLKGTSILLNTKKCQRKKNKSQGNQ